MTTYLTNPNPRSTLSRLAICSSVDIRILPNAPTYALGHPRTATHGFFPAAARTHAATGRDGRAARERRRRPLGRHTSRLPSCPEAAATRGERLCGAGASSARWPEPLGAACVPGEGMVSLGPGRRRSWAGRRRSRLPGPPCSAGAVAQPCRRLPAKGRKSYFAIQRPPRAPGASRHSGVWPWQGAGGAQAVAHLCN